MYAEHLKTPSWNLDKARALKYLFAKMPEALHTQANFDVLTEKNVIDRVSSSRLHEQIWLSPNRFTQGVFNEIVKVLQNDKLDVPDAVKKINTLTSEANKVPPPIPQQLFSHRAT